MIGAIIGDIVGSRFEWHNIKSKDFDLFTGSCRPTDDSVMTVAIAKAILDCDGDFTKLEQHAVSAMQQIGRPHPRCGYGGNFRRWMYSDDPKPYGSFGNGSAMRVSACGWAGKTLEEVLGLAEKVTVTTHDHPEGVKGAQAVAASIFLARTGASKEEIGTHIRENYYDIDFTLDAIRDAYTFDVTCQGSVPQAIEAFLESTDFEDAIRNAVSIGGDSDTIAAITGSIAGAYYGVPTVLRLQAELILRSYDSRMAEILKAFEERYCK